MKYDLTEARRLYEAARSLDLSGWNLLRDPEVVSRECNGIGAEWMPASVTSLVTKLNAVMELPAAIHDRRYTIGGDRAARSAADFEFLTNTLKVIGTRYAWWNPMRYLMSRRAVRYYSYLQLFGDAAWEAAKRERKN